MAHKSRATYEKTRRERLKRQRRMEKQARKLEVKEQNSRRVETEVESDEDPDIAGIVPGPQPLPPELGGPPAASSEPRDSEEEGGGDEAA